MSAIWVYGITQTAIFFLNLWKTKMFNCYIFSEQLDIYPYIHL